MRRVLAVGVGVAIVCALIGGSVSARGGSGEAIQVCRNGGWQILAPSEAASFENQGGCVSYAAQGRTLVVPCLDGEGAFPDARLTASLDTIDNWTAYESFDGSCTGVLASGTVVSAVNGTQALSKCLAIEPTTSFVLHLSSFWHLAPVAWWGCVTF